MEGRASGLAGAVYATKLQAIFPELFRFQVSIMLLCIVILGGMGNPQGGDAGGHVHHVFNRVILAPSTQLVRSLGRLVGSMMLARADLSPSAQRAAELHANEETA